MKVLIVVSSLSFGGAERQAVMDANSLAVLGDNVTIAFNKKGDLANLLDRKIRQYHIIFRNPFLAALQIFAFLCEFRYDIVHSHMFWAERVTSMACFLTGHRLIFNEHGLGLWRNYFQIHVMRIISIFASLIITSCDANRHIRIKREGLDATKIKTLYNSYGTFSKANVKLRRLSPLRHDHRFTIGFVGRFDKVKRIPILIQVAEALRKYISDFEFLLVGDGVERGALELEITRKELWKHFRMSGFVLNIGDYYDKFDIFILPSRVEGFSLALLEAGAFGIPTIAFDCGGNSEIIRDGKTGFLIKEGDIEHLVQSVIYLYKNTKLRSKMGEEAKRYIVSHFSQARRANALMKIYNMAHLN